MFDIFDLPLQCSLRALFIDVNINIKMLHINVTVKSVHPQASAINSDHIAKHGRLVEEEVQMSLC